MTQNNVVRVDVRTDKSWEEILLAEMAEAGFHAFESTNDSLIGYVDETLWTKAIRQKFIDFLKSRITRIHIREDIIYPENWNAQWEASIDPVVAGGFVVLPTWKQVPAEGGETLEPIYIDPKMSFGTGHHETTRLMLELMSGMDFKGKRILDAGTGTGVLAIAAVKKGASSVIGFDIDPWSSDNATENLALNDVENVLIVHGTLADIPESPFDVILANIVQHVIEDSLAGFVRRLLPSGHLIVSGILIKDELQLIQRARSFGLDVATRSQESEWVAFRFVPTT
ncbi:MAG: 50S ribosomal protein L11 methyltransferase [Rhodothermales bacterium]|nr:50S ribosomal protein L11 methyltransferase [Rhodothermales bacterium]